MEGTIGEIRMFGGNFAPRNWAFCSGQLMSIAQNSAMFSILGTTFGGDGRTTFGLPDMRGRAAIHAGHGPGLSDYRLGQKGGVEQVTLNITQIPSHNHTINSTLAAHVGVADDDGNSQDVAGNVLANSPGEQIYSSATPDGQLGGVGLSGTVTAGNTGGNLQHENRMPYLAVNYIICMFGIFPSRG